MAEEGGDGQEKTEEPTQKKKDDARKDGKILTSKEMFVLSSVASATALFMALGGLAPDLSGDWASTLRIDSAHQLDDLVVSRAGDALWSVVWVGLVTGLPMLMITIGMQAAMGGLIFSTKALGFKASKISPMKGFKRMFSAKSLVELGKALLKVGLLGGAAYGVLLALIPQLERMYTMSPGDSAALFGSGLIGLLVALCLALSVIGAVDLGWQLFSLNKGLKMSRQDLKDEAKQSEGSPEQKGQMRRRQMDASQNGAARRKALEDVPNATAIITNPTHFAVALRYNPDERDAPVILAMGKGSMAHRIMERGAKAGVTTIQAPPLARALYFTGNIGQEISEHLYVAVAAILAHVWRLNNDQPTEMPDIDLPTELQLDEFGRPKEDPKR